MVVISAAVDERSRDFRWHVRDSLSVMMRLIGDVMRLRVDPSSSSASGKMRWRVVRGRARGSRQSVAIISSRRRSRGR